MFEIISKPFRVYLILGSLAVLGVLCGWNLPISLFPSSSQVRVSAQVPFGSLSTNHFFDIYGNSIEAAIKKINSALILMEYFHNILDKNKVSEFQEGLKLWEELVMTSKITQFESFLKTVKKHQTRIEAYISSKLTTAISEGINNKIKVLKRVGYTYTYETSFKNKILQRCGFINSRHLDTSEWYWHVPTPH